MVDDDGNMGDVWWRRPIVIRRFVTIQYAAISP